MKIFPKLQTEQLDLVEIKQRHLPDILHIFSNKKVIEFYNMTPLSCEDDAQRIIDIFRDRLTNNTGVRWGISLKGSESIIGTIGFNKIERNHRANIGFELHPDYWNQGIITNSLNAIIRFGFEELEINRIEAEVMIENVNSMKVLDKLKFKNEGILRQWLFLNHKYYDITMYALLRNDYQNM